MILGQNRSQARKKEAGLENKAIAYQTQVSDTRDANAFGAIDSIAAR